MIAEILIPAAAVFKALADTLDHHFFTSVFKKKNQKYWNPNIIHKSAPQIFGYPLDVWHLSNSAMILCFVFAAVFNDTKTAWYWQVSVDGTLFVVVFNSFYNKIFR